MKITFRKPPTLLFPALFLSFALVAGAARNHIFSEDSQFRSFTREVFQKEVSGSMLTLHYSLADPEKKTSPVLHLLLEPSLMTILPPSTNARNI